MSQYPLLNAIVFAFLGIAVFAIAATILIRLTPLKLWHEIIEERNVAAAILAGAVALGLSWIIASAMH